MGRLQIQLTLDKARLVSRILYPTEAVGVHRLIFSQPSALAATLKALDAEEYRPDVDFKPEEQDHLRRMQLVVDGRDRPYFSTRRRQIIGAQLFDCLFPTSKMRGIYEQSRRDATEPRVDVELHIDATAPTLVALPWELAYDDQREDFVIGGGRGTLTRLLAFDDEPPSFAPIEEPQIALVTPRPPGWADLGTLEASTIDGIAGPRADTRRLTVVLRARRFAELKDYLRTHRGASAPHIIHFDGHGGFGRLCSTCSGVTAPAELLCATPGCGQPLNDVVPQGFLICEGVDSAVEYVTARRFADLVGEAALAPQSNLRLVVISACRSGVARGGETVFNGVAQRLVERRVPAVVAMQFTVRAVAAADFAQAFYGELLRGETLAAAVSSAQTGLDREQDQWFRPVLYLRSKDNPEGRLLAPVTSPVRSKARIGLEQVRQHVGDPAVIGALARCKDRLDAVFAQLDVLTDYKTVHDELDKMRPTFRLIQESSARLGSDPGAWNDLLATIQPLSSSTAQLVKVARNGTLGQRDSTDVLRLVEHCERLSAAIDAQTADTAVAVVARMRVSFHLLPDQFNNQLVDAADAVRLPLLEEAMTQLAQALREAHASAEELARVEDGIADLQQQNAQLVALVAEHSRWQSADNVLNTLDQVAPDDLVSLAPIWEVAKSDVGQFFISRSEQWARSLSATAESIEHGLQTRQVDGLKATVSLFTNRARLRFTRLDQDLLVQCERLKSVREGLRALLESIDHAPREAVA